MKMQQSAGRFGAKSEYAEVLSAELTQDVKTVITGSGEFKAKTVIIASGANPRELGLPNEKQLVGKGVHYCAHCDGRFYKGKTVVVVGGGNTAVSDALYLSRIAGKVILVHRRDTLRATKIYREPLLKTENVTFCRDSTVSEILAEESVSAVKLKNVKTGEETVVACDAVFVSIGRKPATGFLSNKLTLDENGYIPADETTRTEIPGVFAAGDVRTKALRQVVTAVSDGANAAYFAEEYLNAK